MPLDSAGYVPAAASLTTQQWNDLFVLKCALTSLRKGAWGKGSYVEPCSWFLARRCAVGWLRLHAGDAGNDIAARYLNPCLPIGYGPYTEGEARTSFPVERFNDLSTTRKRDVIALFERAIAGFAHG